MVFSNVEKYVDRYVIMTIMFVRVKVDESIVKHDTWLPKIFHRFFHICSYIEDYDRRKISNKMIDAFINAKPTIVKN